MRPTLEAQDEPAEDPIGSLEKSDVRHLLRFLCPFIRARCGGLVLLVTVLLIETAVNISFPLAQRYLIDHGLIEKNATVIFVIVAFLAVSALALGGLGLAADFIYSRAVVGIVGDIRELLFDHCQSLDLAYYEKTPKGETLSRFAGDTMAMESALVEALQWFIQPLVQLTYSMVIMFYFNFWLGCLSALTFPIMMILPRHFTRRTFDLNYMKRRKEGELLAAVHENIAGQSIIRAFGYGSHVRSMFIALNSLWRKTSFKAVFMGALVERSAFAALYVLHVGVFAFGAWAVYSGMISLGTLVAYEALFLSMGEALAYATEYVPKLAAAAGGVRHIQEILNVSPEHPDAPDARPISQFSQEIRFQNVAYAFTGSPFRLSALDFTIHKGMKVAIVGRSGSGKSTILSLLMRFRNPTHGTITIDGQDVLHITAASLRARIGFVPQEPLLFNTNIRNNIAVSNPSANLTRIEKAASEAEIHDFIESQPLGYDTPVGEGGGTLSAGQRQRIAIARALLRDPDVLVLDEPTSALDHATEASLNQTIWRAGVNRTVICATHRLAGVVTQVDLIVVLDNGAIKEIGTHPQLLARKGFYSELWQSQNSP